MLWYSCHFVEHVTDVSRLLSELARVVKPNGYVELVAPTSRIHISTLTPRTAVSLGCIRFAMLRVIHLLRDTFQRMTMNQNSALPKWI